MVASRDSMRHEAPSTGNHHLDQMLGLLESAIMHGHRTQGFLRGWQGGISGHPLPLPSCEAEGWMTAYHELCFLPVVQAASVDPEAA